MKCFPSPTDRLYNICSTLLIVELIDNSQLVIRIDSEHWTFALLDCVFPSSVKINNGLFFILGVYGIDRLNAENKLGYLFQTIFQTVYNNIILSG